VFSATAHACRKTTATSGRATRRRHLLSWRSCRVSRATTRASRQTCSAWRNRRSTSTVSIDQSHIASSTTSRTESVSGIVAGRQKRGNAINCFFPNFLVVGKKYKNFLSENFCPKMQNLGLTTPVLEKFKGKIKILSSYNFPCRKLTTVCENFVWNLPRLFFFNPRRGLTPGLSLATRETVAFFQLWKATLQKVKTWNVFRRYVRIHKNCRHLK